MTAMSEAELMVCEMILGHWSLCPSLRADGIGNRGFDTVLTDFCGPTVLLNKDGLDQDVYGCEFRIGYTDFDHFAPLNILDAFKPWFNRVVEISVKNKAETVKSVDELVEWLRGQELRMIRRSEDEYRRWSELLGAE